MALENSTVNQILQVTLEHTLSSEMLSCPAFITLKDRNGADLIPALGAVKQSMV